MTLLGSRYVPSEPEPLSEEVKALLEEKQVDYEASGLKYLSNDARVGQPCYHLRPRLVLYTLLRAKELSLKCQR